jgi:hypothetical protein
MVSLKPYTLIRISNAFLVSFQISTAFSMCTSERCRKRNLSDPESCANAVRVELNDFFGARVALFGTLAGTEPY